MLFARTGSFFSVSLNITSKAITAGEYSASLSTSFAILSLLQGHLPNFSIEGSSIATIITLSEGFLFL